MSNNLTRRNVLLGLGAAGVGSALRPIEKVYAIQKPTAGQMKPIVRPNPARQLNALMLPPFVDALPLPPIVQAPAHRHPKQKSDVTITMREIHVPLHRDLPPARLWSYGDQALGPVIEARSRAPLSVEWVNALPTQHFLAIDFSLHGCGREVPHVRNCVHVHGARVPSRDDGHPDDWYVPGKMKRSVYPLEQDAACLWYHDHAMGINRLNVYAGLFGFFIVRDGEEDRLNLPAARHELPLVLYDRVLTSEGQLLYPESGDPDHPWVPDFRGDALLINGKIRPYHEVEPCMYRLRLLNASNGRFYDLSLTNSLPFLQIGSDQGLLRQVIALNRLVLAPGERADLLVDFSAFAAGTLHLRTGAVDMLQFRVGQKAREYPGSFPVNTSLREIAAAREETATVVRTITLNEYTDPSGGSMQMLLNRLPWHHEVTEKPKLGSTEIWQFVNQTEDTHPMHLHLVRFRILDRQPFDTFKLRMTKDLEFTGPREAAAHNEQGWKDVVQCGPGLVTRILVTFEGYTGDYLYHCHIMEHEANDMMRPYIVTT